MQSRVILFICCLFVAWQAHAQYSFPACWTPWTPNPPAGYPGGTQVSHNNGNYQAKWSTVAEPGTNGDWALVSKCGDGGLGPNYTGPQRIIGYLPYWVPDFDLTTFDPGTVNHINIAFNLFQQNNNNFNGSNFASIAWGTFHNRKVDSVLFDAGVLSRAHAKGVTVSVAIGGATDYAFLWLLTQYYNNDAKIDEIATFIASYVNTKGIDGVDLDLECWWPDATISGTTEQGGRVRGDKWGGPDQGPHPAGIGLTKLAQKLRQKMPNKLISAAVFATSYYGNNYDDAVAQHLDWLGLMTYDFTGSWNTSPVGPHASLYKVPLGTYQGQSADNPIYSAQDALEYWMGFAPAAWNHDGGFNVPKAKLCIGVPFYGYDLATRKPNNANGFVALKWTEIIAAYPNAATSYDPLDTRQLGGYIGANGKKIYYETPKGAGEKIKYTKNYGHQGVIMWELTGDVAYSSSNSLLKAINEAAGNNVNPPPTVSITSPANNASFSPSSNITIAASASDNGSVTKVEFFQGSTKLGEDASSPYSFTWNNVSAGSYALTAKATDNQNASTTSSAVNITVGNAAPVVSITSPANNASYSTGATVTINATASDSDGTVSKVEFYQGSTKLGEDTSTPYAFSWVSVPAGSYVLTAKATDNLNATTTSAAVNISVGNTNPTTSITSPANNASFSAPASITISANAADSDGTITKVEFFQGSTKLGEDNSSPYSFTWSNVGAGNYALTTKATDNAGGTSTSAVINISVTSGCTTPAWNAATAYNGGAEVSRNGNRYQAKWWTQGEDPVLKSGPDDVWRLLGPCGNNVNPSASITAPANGATFAAPACITINVSASDTDGTIAKVEFYQGSTKLGEDTTSPYSFSWCSVGAGSYSLTAKAIDNAGGIGTSSAVSVTVTGNNNPSVSITTPANNASFTAPASVTINASASDSDGTIAKVEFFQGSTKLGEDASSPYSFTWTNVAAGTYSLTAKATDNASGTATSSAVNITVNGSDNCSTIAQYVENGGYVAGSQVKNAGSQYECKPYPFSGWCNGAAWAYAPGTGTYWQDAWILKGSCSGSGRLAVSGIETTEDTEIENLLTESDGLSVYPNPRTAGGEQIITLTFDKTPKHVQVRLQHVNGVEILSRDADQGKSRTMTISPPALSPGLYIIRVRADGSTWTKKYLVK
ncbi:MAG: Ig-like domain-containing protein [Bacteroidota bacterium]